MSQLLCCKPNLMNKILDQLGKMPTDFWVLMIAIPILVVACILLLIAKRHRYKDFDKDGELLAPIRIEAGVDLSDATGALFDGLGDGGSHH